MKSYVLCLMILSAPLAAFSQWHGPNTPDSLSFQGYLTNSVGVPIDVPTNMTFKLYKGANQIWTQTQNGVPVSNGVFNVILGGSGAASLDTVVFNEQVDLGITIGGLELLPRTPLTSAAYALGMRGMSTFLVNHHDNRAMNVMGGTSNNQIVAGSVGVTLGGGGGWFEASPQGNTAGGDWSVISGGALNVTGEDYSTVGGGRFNEANGLSSTIAGGYDNTAGGYYSTVGGGSLNISSGTNSTVPGGQRNMATRRTSFAAGQRAEAVHSGAFVWADSVSDIGVPFASTGVNQFLIRASGGVGIGTNTPATQLEVQAPANETDVVLGGTSIGVDNGSLSSDPTFTSSDLILVGYDDVAIHLDENNDEFGNFLITNGANSNVVSIDEVGNAVFSGSVTKSGGNFRIDHPLDPANKYLNHSFVESPDMMNIYNGNVTLDDRGEAVIEMPSYFEALNREFRYQLTAIGAPGPNLFVSKEIAGNRFAVAGGSPGMRVSWMVTGVRKDPYAEDNRIEVEVDKSADERGTYLYPRGYAAGTD